MPLLELTSKPLNADEVTGQVLEIDNRQSGAKNKLSDLVFLSGKYHISLTFPRDFGFVWRFSTIAIACSNLLLHITVFENCTKKSHFSTLIWWRLSIISMTTDNDGWTSFLFDGHCPSNQWTKIMVDELHFCLMADRVWQSKTFLVILKHCELDIRCFIIHFRCCWKIKIKHVTYASLSFFLPYLMLHPFSRPKGSRL